MADNRKKRNQDKINFTGLSSERLFRLALPFRVDNGKKFQIKHFDPSEDGGIGVEEKVEAAAALQLSIDMMSELQEKLYAQDKWSLLLIFQAMDAAGKDGTIKHVMSGINPQGCQVTAFKAPSQEELDHDYLWRCVRHLPERGRIGIFNRSYYEEVLVVRVHEQILKSQKLPPELITKKIWKERLEDIRNFEQYLRRNGTIVCKFFLNISKAEQKKRFMERIENPSKNWKFEPNDVKERGYWKNYMNAYEEMIQATATKQSPWYVIPADDKAFCRLAVASAIIETLSELHLDFPAPDKSKLEALAQMKALLLSEKQR
jgi:PPK2 family polyphosphate:nucleotide phosphotransferase